MTVEHAASCSLLFVAMRTLVKSMLLDRRSKMAVAPETPTTLPTSGGRAGGEGER